jgi:YfiH family protein
LAKLEFPLQQGWYKDLSIHFEDEVSSREMKLDNSFLYPKQVHGNGIHQCGQADLGKDSAVAEADGVMADAIFLKMTQKKMLIQTADCLPLVYIERDKKKIALIHAGWRGLAQKIHLKPFDAHGFKPSCTLIWVGPSLNGRNFEVGEDVWSLFPDFKNDGEVFEATGSDPKKRFFHVWNYLDKVFTPMGVELVYKTGVDTFADTSFASYRRNKKQGVTGNARNFTWVGFSS